MGKSYDKMFPNEYNGKLVNWKNSHGYINIMYPQDQPIR